jgi:hypothetical protein
MPNCVISTDFLPSDCVSLESGGVSGAAYGIDFEVWKRATITRASDGTISAITLTGVGDQAVKYDLPYGASIPSTPFTQNNGGKSGFAHSVNMFLPTKLQALKKEIAGYGNFGRMVWIVVLDASVVANVFGNDMGLRLSAYDELPNDPAKGGGIDVTWSTPTDATLENLPPVTFFNTSRADTLAALDALMTPVPTP